jgi:hypothetical protein
VHLPDVHLPVLLHLEHLAARSEGARVRVVVRVRALNVAAHLRDPAEGLAANGARPAVAGDLDGIAEADKVVRGGGHGICKRQREEGEEENESDRVRIQTMTPDELAPLHLISQPTFFIVCIYLFENYFQWVEQQESEHE